MLRTTQSNLIYLQQLGRLVEAENLNKYLVVFDFVNNFSSVNDGIGLLKEIKDAIGREKESDPDFDDNGFEDIDTFFVIDQVLEIQEVFQEIEGRLEGSWDVMFQKYCKFYEENGHGDVPKTEEYKELNVWCVRQRQNLSDGILNEERKKLLDKYSFIWDVYRHRFLNKVQKCIHFYKKNGRLPIITKNDDYERKLAYFIRRNKKDMENDVNYPIWKKDLIMEIPDFLNYNNENDFDRFYAYAIAYKEKYGHMNIKSKDFINGYNLGGKYFKLKKEYQNDKLSKYKIEKLQEIGFIFESKLDKQFNDKMDLASKAVKEGVLISNSNQIYNGENLYRWLFQTVKQKFYNEELLQEQVEIIQKLIGKSLYRLFNMAGYFVRVTDVIEKKEIGIYKSQRQVVKEMQEKFNINITIRSVWMHLNSKINSPYKGRFMFYYATDEEVKKYLEENKVS